MNQIEQNQKRIFGRIFTPEEKENKIHAWLMLSETGVVLEASIVAERSEYWPILLGEFNGMDSVTFLNCRAAGGVFVGAGGPIRTIRVATCISGGHFYQQSDLLFRSATLISPALAEWIVWDKMIERIGEGKYQIPDHQQVVNTNIGPFNLAIHNSHSIRSSDKELNVKRVCSVTIEAIEPISLDSFIQSWRHLKKLILFLTHKNPEFAKIFLYTESHNEFEYLQAKQTIRDDRFSISIDLTYHDISDCLNSIISNWFNNKKLNVVIDLALEKLMNTEMSTQGFFLNVCIALETFHSEFISNDEMSIKERLKKRESIAMLIQDQNLAAWFKKESSYWKNPSLKERLFAFKDLITVIKGNVFKAYDVDTFISKVVKTRNDIAHSGEYLKQFTYIELFIAAKVIEFTLRIKIMKEIGINVHNDGKYSLLNDARDSITVLARMNNYE